MAAGKRIKERREQLGLSQKELADLMGVSAGAIGSWEVELTSPKEANFHKLFEVLDCEPNFIFQDYCIQKEPSDENIEEFKESMIALVESIDDVETLKGLISYVEYLIWLEEQS